MAADISATLSLSSAAAVLGMSTYLATFRLSLDNHGWRILGFWSSLTLLSFLALSQSYGLSLAAVQTSFIAALFLSGFFGSTATYRLVFSPIRKFPGPPLASLSSFYRVYLASKSGIQLCKEIDVLHQSYGDCVRVSPREVSILNPNAIPVLYGPRSQCLKGPWYDHYAVPAEEDKQVFLLRDRAMHSWRRRIFDGGFSSKAVSDYEARVQETVNLLLRQLEARAEKPLNLQDWISFFAFDVMGRVAYNQDFGMLQKGEGIVTGDEQSTSIQAMHETTRLFGILGAVPWVIRMITATSLANDMTAFYKWCHNTMRNKQEARLLLTFDATTTAPADIASHLLVAAQNPRDAHRLQTQLSLQNDSLLIILAGSDTTASAIANALFYLVRDPAYYFKLRAALDALPDCSARTLASCRYLDFVINETLRLKPPIPGGLGRETPPQGISIPEFPTLTSASSGSDSVNVKSGSSKETFIPGGIIVSVPTWSLHRDGRLWGPDANEFRPDRWEDVDTTVETAPFIPFTRGTYACPGKALGYMEMRAVVAGMVKRFDLELAEGQSAAAFDDGCLDTFTLTNLPLWVVIRKR
ncbi:cytochrome P450, partial [Phyllosticta paracitricarpa]